MKTKLSTVGFALAVSPLLTCFNTPAQAHDRGWSTAGKVLTGIFAAQTLSRLLDPPVYFAPAPIIVQQPVYIQPAPIVVQTVQTTPVTQTVQTVQVQSAPPAYAVASAPTVPSAPLAPAAPTLLATPQTVTQTTTTTSYVVQQPVYVQPTPVYVQAPVSYGYTYAAPVYCAPPLIGFRFGVGYHHGWGRGWHGR